MENISEAVIVYMTGIAIFQIIIIFTIMRIGGKKVTEEIPENKRSLIDLLNNPSKKSELTN